MKWKICDSIIKRNGRLNNKIVKNLRRHNAEFKRLYIMRNLRGFTDVSKYRYTNIDHKDKLARNCETTVITLKKGMTEENYQVTSFQDLNMLGSRYDKSTN